jgi:hypothetical protein
MVDSDIIVSLHLVIDFISMEPLLIDTSARLGIIDIVIYRLKIKEMKSSARNLPMLESEL